MSNPLVSVNIPTHNSASTLRKTLHSVVEQNYRPIEIVVADSFSSDDSRKIADHFGCIVVRTSSKLLGARREAFLKSGGDYIMLLDSDQILRPNTIQRCVAMVGELDMLM